MASSIDNETATASPRSIFDVPIGHLLPEQGIQYEPVPVWSRAVPDLEAAARQGYLLVCPVWFMADGVATAYRGYCNRISRPCVELRRRGAEAEIRLAMQPTSRYLPPDAMGRIFGMLMAEGFRADQVAVDPDGAVVRGVPLARARGLAGRLFNAAGSCHWVDVHPYQRTPSVEERELIEPHGSSEAAIYLAFEENEGS